jgi:inner membrane protein YidH
VAAPDDGELDYRFSLANERTYLAWIRTALGMIAGGVVAAKALGFEHDVLRWIVAAPPIVAGAVMAAHAPVRWRVYEQAMREGRRLPIGRGVQLLGVALAVYALVVLAASILDG